MYSFWNKVYFQMMLWFLLCRLCVVRRKGQQYGILIPVTKQGWELGCHSGVWLGQVTSRSERNGGLRPCVWREHCLSLTGFPCPPQQIAPFLPQGNFLFYHLAWPLGEMPLSPLNLEGRKGETGSWVCFVLKDSLKISDVPRWWEDMSWF